MRKSGPSGFPHHGYQVRSAVRPGTRPSTVKATLGRNKLWVATEAKTDPALTKSKRPTPVFPVPADSLKARAYTHMAGVPQGADAGFCSDGWNRCPPTKTPTLVRPERSRRQQESGGRRAGTSAALGANGGPFPVTPAAAGTSHLARPAETGPSLRWGDSHTRKRPTPSPGPALYR